MVWGLERRKGERDSKRVCIQSLRMRNDVSSPRSAGSSLPPHSPAGDSGPEGLGRRTSGISRFISLPFLPKSGWVGSGVGQASGESAHSPAPALAPNNATSPSPSPLSGGLLGSGL